MLNWKIRYNPLIASNPELHDASKTVAEIGCGRHGIAKWLNREVIGVELHDTISEEPNLKIRQGSAYDLPFSDNEVDILVCVDVLEHITPSERGKVIQELCRVAKEKVIISCPCHSRAFEGEQNFEAALQRFGLTVPLWLVEHFENGLPSVGEIVAFLCDSDHPFTVKGNETMLQHYAGVILEIFYGFSSFLNDELTKKAPNSTPLSGSEWDYYYSFIFTIDTTQSVKARTLAPEMSPTSIPGRAKDYLLVSDLAIYSVYHKELPTDHLGWLKPIYAGLETAYADSQKLTDQLPNGVRLDNKRWSELSSIYRVWKAGPKTAVVGFCHYRRLFDFSQSNSDRLVQIRWENIYKYTHNLIDLNLLKKCLGGVIFTIRPHKLLGNIFDDYCNNHNTNDYLEAFTILCDLHPDFRRPFAEQFSSTDLYANNMFIMSWEIFDELCNIWFPTLFEFEHRHPDRNVGSFQTRDVSFLAERIFDAWVRLKKSQSIPVVELPMYFIN